jgi:hypothetical protein
MLTELVDLNTLDVFVCELARIDRLGANRRLIFTVPSIERANERNVVAKLIVPAEYLPSMVNLLAREACAVEGGEKIAPEVLRAMETGAAAGLIPPVRRPGAETKAGRRTKGAAARRS